jgi:hypothetical protein
MNCEFVRKNLVNVVGGDLKPEVSTQVEMHL